MSSGCTITNDGVGVAASSCQEASPWSDDLCNGLWPRSFAYWMTVFYLALFVIRPWEKLIPQLATFPFERICAILVILVVIMSGRGRLRFDRQMLTIFLLAAALGLSGLFVVGPAVPYVFLTVVAFYLILTSVVRTPYELIFMIASYLGIMGIYLGKSLWEFYVHGAGQYEMGVYRLQGIELTFGNDNALANSVIYSLPMLSFLYSSRAEFCISWPDYYRKWYVRGLITYAFLAIVSILLTRSRMGFISLCAFLVILALRRGNLLQKLFAISTVFIGCAAVYSMLPTDAQNRIQTIWQSASDEDDEFAESARESTQGRWDGLAAGTAMFKQHPVFGVGNGNFIPYRQARVDGVELESHNLLGQLAGETGIVGASAFAIFLFTLLSNSRNAQLIARFNPGQLVPQVMSRLALSCRDLVALLLLTGLSTHNLDRFNWLLAGAFCALAVEFSAASLSRQRTAEQLRCF